VKSTAQTNTPTPEQQIVLSARVGPRRITFTASQLRDTVASYIARGERMPTPTDINGSDPIEHFHVIVEEWLYGNVQGWLNSTDVVHLEQYRHQAMKWLHRYFSFAIGGFDHQPSLPNLDHIPR
jgi:hypothetical protein